MKVKCENIVVCGNYNCIHNCETLCVKTIISLDQNGQCALCQLKPKPKEYVKTDSPAQIKHNAAFDVETSE